MNAAQSQGLAGLAGSINKTDANERNMQYMQMLDQSKKADDLANEQAQIQEQQYYEMLNQKAEGLLAGDRKAVNQKALKMQAAIKQQIEVAGGNRKLFFKNGGHSLLKGYIDSVANSEEMVTYKENKVNSVKILDARDKGFGHLLLDKDKQSALDYEKNGSGKISYSGLLQAIDIPPSDNYNLNSPIPLDDIVNFEQNRMKIVGNYMMENPNAKDVDDATLKQYADDKGYAGLGSNRDAIDALRKAALENAKNKADAAKQSASDTRPDMYQQIFEQTQRLLPQTTVGELSGDGTKPVNYYTDNMGKNKQIGIVGLGGRALRSKVVNNDEAGLDYSNDSTVGTISKVLNYFNDIEAELAHGGQVYTGGDQLALAKVALGGIEINTDGTVKLMPGRDFYNSEGTQGIELASGDKYDTNYKIEGFSTGAKVLDENNNGILVMNYFDEGKFSATETKKHVDNIRTKVPEPVVVMALRHPDGYLFYKEVPKTLLMSNAFSSALGPVGNLTEQTQAAQKVSDAKAAAEKSAVQGQQAIKQNLVTIDGDLQNHPGYIADAKEFSKEGVARNRSSLIKSFYAAMSGDGGPQVAQTLATNRGFTRFMAQSGADVELAFKAVDGGFTDLELIDLWETAAVKDETPEVMAANYGLAESWRNSLKNYSDLTK